MPDIHVNHLSFKYSSANELALNDVDLSIAKGEFILVSGPSGCGKSTLALALAGLIPNRISGSVRGEVYLGSVDLSTLPIHEASQHVGIVFQNPEAQLIHYDVETEVAFGPENLTIDGAELDRRVVEAMKWTGIRNIGRNEISKLSGGQKQRVAIAATLAMQPDVLVLDEPTSDLDPVGTQEVLGVLRELNRRHGMTIVVVEHKVDEVIPWVDRVILMDDGQVALDSPVRSAFDDLTPWSRLGIMIPEVVQLSKVLPRVFGDKVALSVQDAENALWASSCHQTLKQSDVTLQLNRNEHLTNPDMLWDKATLNIDRKRILTDVNLSVNRGEWVSLIGANGSGKTTLAGLAMGFQKLTKGCVTTFGNEVTFGKIAKQARKIGYLFQSADKMLFTQTVDQELSFGRRHGEPGHAVSETIEREITELLDLKRKLKDSPYSLSHGQRQRLAIGTLLTTNPEAIILDEPTTGQDERHALQFLKFLDELRLDKGLSYLMITHNMRSVAKFSTRVAAMSEGEIRVVGSPAYVYSHVEILQSCGVLPPPIPLLHARLSKGTRNVALTVEAFLRQMGHATHLSEAVNIR